MGTKDGWGGSGDKGRGTLEGVRVTLFGANGDVGRSARDVARERGFSARDWGLELEGFPAGGLAFSVRTVGVGISVLASLAAFSVD